MGNAESSNVDKTSPQDELNDSSSLSYGQQYAQTPNRQQHREEVLFQQHTGMQNGGVSHGYYYDKKVSSRGEGDIFSTNNNDRAVPLAGRYPLHVPYPHSKADPNAAYYSNQVPPGNSNANNTSSYHRQSQHPTSYGTSLNVTNATSSTVRKVPASDQWTLETRTSPQRQQLPGNSQQQHYGPYIQQVEGGAGPNSSHDPRQQPQYQHPSKGKTGGGATAYLTSLSSRIPQWTTAGSPKTPQRQQLQQPHQQHSPSTPNSVMSSSTNTTRESVQYPYAQSTAPAVGSTPSKRGHFFGKKPPLNKADATTTTATVSRTPSSVNVSVMYAVNPNELRSPTHSEHFHTAGVAHDNEAFMSNMSRQSQTGVASSVSFKYNNDLQQQEQQQQFPNARQKQHHGSSPFHQHQPLYATAVGQAVTHTPIPPSQDEAQNDDTALWKNAWEEDDDDSVEEGESSSTTIALVEALRISDMTHPFQPAMDTGHSAVSSLEFSDSTLTASKIVPSHHQQLDVTPDEDDILSRRADLIIEKDGVKWESSPIIHEKPSITMFYPLLRVLGKGSFGKVVLVRKRVGHERGELFAMKVLRKAHLVKRRQIERTKTERKVLAVVDHPFIMKLHFAFQTEDKLYLVLDYCPGGELFFHLSRYRRFPERVARFYSAELVLAIDHLHSKGIIYRDLKPENVLLDAEGHVKLGDFGLAKDKICHPCQGATSMCGTPEYMSPEVLAQLGHGFCVDYWGLGMLVYEMMTGLPPWYTTDRSKLFKRLKSAPLEIPSYFSSVSADFVKQLLHRNQYKRLGFNGVEEVKTHSFYQHPPLNFELMLQRRAEAPIRPCEGWKAVESSTPQNSMKSNYFNSKSTDYSSQGEERTEGISNEILDAATANFDKAFTRMPVETDDATPAEHGGSGGTGSEEELNFDTFVGFTFDETNSPPSRSNSFT
jgi:serum/glucocorticoid-regulated kinase 2